MAQTDITIRLGQQGQDLAKMYPRKLKINDKNANGEMVFYNIDWTRIPYQQSLGNVHVDNGAYSFTVPYVLGLTGLAVPSDTPEEGIEKFSLGVGMSEATVLHPEAQRQFYALLKTIQKAGWKRQIRVAFPRISGRDALVFSQMVESSHPIDPDYMPTFQEWMWIRNYAHWNFYANGVYLDVSFQRGMEVDPDKLGAYLITMKFETRNAWERAHFQGKERLRWRELYPPTRQHLKTMRPVAEQKIRAEGKYHIDESYRNPDDDRPEST